LVQHLCRLYQNEKRRPQRRKRNQAISQRYYLATDLEKEIAINKSNQTRPRVKKTEAKEREIAHKEK